MSTRLPADIRRHVSVLMVFIFIFFQVVALGALMPFANADTVGADLTIGDYTLVKITPQGQLGIDFSFKARITNHTSRAFHNVTATVTSRNPNLEIPDASLSFGEVAAGASVRSSDTFTLRLDRLLDLVNFHLNWTTHCDNLPVVSLIATPTTITSGQSTTLNWQTLDATTASIAPGIGNVALNGSMSVSPAMTTTYTLSATGPGGTSTATTTVTVNIPPPLAPVLNTATAGNGQVALGWSVASGAAGYSVKYRTSSGQYGTPISVGNVTGYTVTGLTNGTTYYFVVTASNAGGTSPNSNEMSATPQAPTPVAPALNSATGGAGQVALQWSSVSNATGYKIYYGTAPGVYGTPVTTGNVTQYTLSGLSARTTYYLAVTAENSGSESPKSNELSATTTVIIPPTVGITADPLSISQGQATLLSWQSANATTCSIAPGIGNVALNGTLSVQPAATTSYTITATGPGGTATQSVTVAVNELRPTVTILASPQTIASGGSTTLSWSSANAASLFIDNGVGAAAESGSRTVQPTTTTTYTITATGPLGSASAQVTVVVTGTPAWPAAGTFGSRYSSLIPADATVASYDIKRFAVVRGEVRDTANAPIAGVSVTIQGQAAYGTAYSDADGKFSLPVEGGGTLNVRFRKAGLIPTDRQVLPRPNDIAVVETVTMIAEDTKSTVVNLDGNAGTVVVHQSTPVSDSFGSRQTNLVFTGNTQAYAVDKNGQDMFPLTQLTVRASEFTTPQSMPAVLPPTSAFTYCVELKVDGVERVRFSRPVVMWVDNFLGFNVGETVPVGYYDRDRGVWVPSANGKVVRLLDTDGDGVVDALDANGDGQPDDLNADGSVADEVKGLNDPTKYHPGQTYWRVELTHFSPWDLNWPYVPTPGSIPPNAQGGATADNPKGCAQSPGDCQGQDRSRVVHKDIQIPGTNVTLHYASDRVGGYQTVITVPASGPTVPSVLSNIRVTVNIAGRVFQQTLPAAPNQTAAFVWDGRDYLGNKVATATAEVTTEFVYPGVYFVFGPTVTTPVFGVPGGTATNITSRGQFIYASTASVLIGNQAQVREVLAEGWTLSNHHYLNAADTSTLYKGDGNIVQNYVSQIEMVAQTQGFVYDIALDNSQNIYMTEGHRIIKIDINGIRTIIAGNGIKGYSGDGGLATAAQLNRPNGLAVDNSGNIYIADTDNFRVRKIDTNGIITTVAGNGIYGYRGDYGLATNAAMRSPTDVALDNSGNLYISDYFNASVRKVDILGIITTVAGTGFPGFSGDGGPATAAQLEPEGLAVDNSGNIYIADGGNYRIRKVNTSGIITTVAGNGIWGYSGDGGPATAAMIYIPSYVAVDHSGNLYISDMTRIRKVDTNGIITTIAGSGVGGYSGDGGPALDAQMNFPFGIEVDSLNNIYFSDSNNYRIRRVTASAFVPAGPGEMAFAEEGAKYIFSLTGKHLRTVEPDTGKVVEEFGYDPAGRLVSVTDLYGNQLTVERNAAGTPTAIVAPQGKRTALTIDANNHLEQITHPDSAAYQFGYTSDALLTSEAEPEGNLYTNAYDTNGRRTDALDQENGHLQFNRQVAASTGDVTTTVTGAEGNTLTFLDHYSAGSAYTSTVTVSGVASPLLYSMSADRMSAQTTLPDQTLLDSQAAIDPELKFKFLKQADLTTPSGGKATLVTNRTYADTNADGTKDLIVRSVTLNGKTTTVTHNVLTSQITASSPLSRTMTVVYNPLTLLPTTESMPGLLDTTYQYDSRGRVTDIQTGTRHAVLTYDSVGNLNSVRDPKGQTTTYEYDAAGRVTVVRRPDLTTLRFAYDTNGNMTTLLNPASVAHLFTYNKINQPASGKPPISAQTTATYDKEHRPLQVNFASGKQIHNVYTASLLTQIQTPEGNIDITYLPSGKPSSITKGAEALSYTYDGVLLLSETSSGTLSQTVSFGYNSELRPVSMTYAGAAAALGYDDDGLLTSVGNYTITRDAQNGLATTVAGGTLSLSRMFNGYGEVASQAVTVNGTAVGNLVLTYDDNGQIINKAETMGGVAAQYNYAYDAQGRLLTVEKDGTLVEEYRYNDPLHPGLRTYEMNTLRGIAGRSLTYNSEDQLLSNGGTTLEYDADGLMVKRTEGANVWTVAYSARGELTGLIYPDGRIMDFVYDAQGRLIARRVNGTVTEKYLWSGLTRLLAVYDGSDSLLMRFEYADGRMPVSMVTGGQRYYLGYDQVGSLRTVTEAGGAVVKRIDYDTFGNIVFDTDPGFAVPFGFAGGLKYPDIGLLHFGYRDYDPDSGRWIQKDPIGFAGGDVNVYGYCLDDPVNGADPFGLIDDGGFSWKDWAESNWNELQMVAQSAGPMYSLLYGGSFASQFFNWINGFQKVSPAPDDDTTCRLQSHVTKAAKRVDNLGDDAFTDRQWEAIQRNPNLRAMYRGNRIDVMAREWIENDPSLSHLESNYSGGPDFVDPVTGEWWDMTTPGQWIKHEQRYGSGGSLLSTVY